MSGPETDPSDRDTAAMDQDVSALDRAVPDWAETRIAMLEREVRELREANEILRNVAGFLASADTSNWH